MKPAVVRFYLDADILGLAKILAGLRPDVTYPSDPGGMVHKRVRPPCTVSDRAALDTVWIPECARQDWLIVTRDSRIQSHTRELEAVRSNGARMVAPAGADARSTWSQLELFMCQWRRIERCLEQRGPFIYSVIRTTFNAVAL